MSDASWKWNVDSTVIDTNIDSRNHALAVRLILLDIVILKNGCKVTAFPQINGAKEVKWR